MQLQLRFKLTKVVKELDADTSFRGQKFRLWFFIGQPVGAVINGDF